MWTKLPLLRNLGEGALGMRYDLWPAVATHPSPIVQLLKRRLASATEIDDIVAAIGKDTATRQLRQ